MGNEEYVCRICKGKHWCWLNAVECCDDIKLEERRTSQKDGGMK